MRDTLDLDKFYTADLKLFVEVARKEIERLQEENLLLKASEPMSKLAEDYGYKTRCEKAIEYIEKWQSFQHTNGTTHEELRNLKGILKGE